MTFLELGMLGLYTLISYLRLGKAAGRSHRTCTGPPVYRLTLATLADGGATVSEALWSKELAVAPKDGPDYQRYNSGIFWSPISCSHRQNPSFAFGLAGADAWCFPASRVWHGLFRTCPEPLSLLAAALCFSERSAHFANYL
jgi:hypothetical protein